MLTLDTLWVMMVMYWERFEGGEGWMAVDCDCHSARLQVQSGFGPLQFVSERRSSLGKITILKHHSSVTFKLGNKLKPPQNLLSLTKRMRQHFTGLRFLEEKNMSR